MIYFTLPEILLSVISALIYGLLFAFSAIFVRAALTRVAVAAPLLLSTCLRYDKNSFTERIRKSLSSARRSRLGGNVQTFFVALIFTVGIILLSYYSLDGAVRIYTVILSLLAAYFPYKYARIPIDNFFDNLFFLIICSVGIIVGVPISLIRHTLSNIYRRILKIILSRKSKRKSKRTEKTKAKHKEKSNENKTPKTFNRNR